MQVSATLRRDLLAIVRAAVGAADAGRLVARALDVDAGGITKRGRTPFPVTLRSEEDRGRVSVQYTETRPLYVIAAGKASAAMARVAADRLGPRLRGGVVIGARAANVPRPLESIVGGHPVPTPGSENGGRRALAIAESLSTDDTLLVLLSGGASALMAVPADGLTLDDKRRTTEGLLRAGADIQRLNTVRKHLSAIKGGWLAARTAAHSVTYAISDVVDDDLSVIASGPTTADRTTYQDALDVLRRYHPNAAAALGTPSRGGIDAYPATIVRHLDRGIAGEIPETPKPGDARLARAQSAVIGGRRDALAGGAKEARRRGYQVVIVEQPIVGEARDAAREHVRHVAGIAQSRLRPLCVMSGGETTVRVTGRGRGGRNQEFALAAAPLLSGLSGTRLRTGTPSPIALASVGTDGIDGPTDAAGALADSTTMERARSAGLDAPDTFLNDNNAYVFFDALGDLIHTGPTDTNVGDLQMVLFA